MLQTLYPVCVDDENFKLLGDTKEKENIKERKICNPALISWSFKAESKIV